MRLRGLAVAALALLLAAGCGSDDTGTGTPTHPDSQPVTPTLPQAGEIDEDGPLAAAIADLAYRTGVERDRIEVVANDQVTWRDGSLGCPRPGMSYTQALVDGYRIILRADDQEVAYHGRSGAPPFRCEHPDPNGAAGPPAH